MEKTTQKEKGITLIALIITVIVMLILVGVTINVALNGGLFDSADYAATETKKETEKEQLLEAVVGAIGTDGKVDSTKISLPEGFTKDDSKSTSSKLVVKGKEGIYWEVNLSSAAIKEYSESSAGATTYTFTVGDLARKGLLTGDASGTYIIPAADFWGEGVSDELKNSTKSYMIDGQEFYVYNITCSKSDYTSYWDAKDKSSPPKTYALLVVGDQIGFILINENGDAINSSNYTNYIDMSFTVSMWE